MLELLFWPALIGYGEAAVAYSSPRFTRGARDLGRPDRLAAADGAAGRAGRAHGRFPWDTWAGSLNLFVWLVVGGYLFWGCRPRYRLLGLAVMPLAAVLFLVAGLGGGTETGGRPTTQPLPDPARRPRARGLRGLHARGSARRDLPARGAAAAASLGRPPAPAAAVARDARALDVAGDRDLAAAAHARDRDRPASTTAARSTRPSSRRCSPGSSTAFLRAAPHRPAAAHIALTGFAVVIVAPLGLGATFEAVARRHLAPRRPGRAPGARRAAARPRRRAPASSRATGRCALDLQPHRAVPSPRARRPRARDARGDRRRAARRRRLPHARRGRGRAPLPCLGRARLDGARRERDPRPGQGGLRGAARRAAARPALSPGAPAGQRSARDRDRREPRVRAGGRRRARAAGLRRPRRQAGADRRAPARSASSRRAASLPRRHVSFVVNRARGRRSSRSALRRRAARRSSRWPRARRGPTSSSRRRARPSSWSARR